MRLAALLGVLVLSGGCQAVRSPFARPPGVGVLVQGVTVRCAPLVVGSTVRRVCLPPPGAKTPPDSASGDSVAVAR